MIRRPPRSTRTDTLIPYNDALPIFLDLCAGDIGGSAARTWDIEAYAPGCDMWLEVSSVSWFTDYQARRANIRFRPSEGKGTRSEEHTPELQSLMRISYAVFCLKKNSRTEHHSTKPPLTQMSF